MNEKWLIMNKEYDLKIRTKRFVVDIIKVCNQLPNGSAFEVFLRQLIRC